MAQPVVTADLITPDAYLATSRDAEQKLVLWDGEVFAMAGASQRHNLLVAAVLGDLRTQLMGKGCAPYASDQRVRLPGGDRYVYPDATVVRRPVETDPRDAQTITNPRVLVEVLSDSTEACDRGAKFIAYRELASLTDYLLVSQREARIEHYARRDDGSWVLRTATAGGEVELASVGVRLLVDRLYAGVFDDG